MENSICIPMSQYMKMLDSYDKAMEELAELRDALKKYNEENHTAM